MKTVLLIAVSLCASFSPPAFAAGTPKAIPPVPAGIAVLVIQHEGLSEAESNDIANHVATAMTSAGIPITFGHEAGARILKKKGFDTACKGDPKCVAFLGSTLGVATVVAIQVDAPSKTFVGTFEAIYTTDKTSHLSHPFSVLRSDLKSGPFTGLDEFIAKMKDLLPKQAQEEPKKASADMPLDSTPKKDPPVATPASKGTLTLTLGTPVVVEEPAKPSAPEKAAPTDKWCASWGMRMPLADSCPPCPPGSKEVKDQCVFDSSYNQPEVVEKRPPPTRIMTILGIGTAMAGAAATGTGVAFRVMEGSDYASATGANGTNRAEFDARKQSGIANSERANVLLAVGSAALAVGGALIVIDIVRHSEPSKSVNSASVVFTGSGVGLAGTW